jgi:hypothetical protein
MGNLVSLITTGGLISLTTTDSLVSLTTIGGPMLCASAGKSIFCSDRQQISKVNSEGHLWASRWPLGALQSHKYNKVYLTLECIPRRRTIPLLQQLYSYRGQLLPDDSSKACECLRITIAYILQLDAQGGQEKPAIQETWMGPRQLTTLMQSGQLSENTIWQYQYKTNFYIQYTRDKQKYSQYEYRNYCILFNGC